MAIINFKETLYKCEEHWKAAQRNSSFRYTVFTPVFDGEKYDGEIEGMNTFSTSWDDDEIISYDNQGFDEEYDEENLNFEWRCDDWGISPMSESETAIYEFAERNNYKIK